MKLIADSGSTKTIWTFTEGKDIVQQQVSPGINPYQQDEPEILSSINEALAERGKEVQKAYFYGSGVTSANVDKIERSLRTVCRNLDQLDVQNDVWAAARSLCRNEPGIAGIMGTGSNSCLWNGQKIIGNIGGFGFILGDEGSGAVLGKQVLTANFRIDYLKPAVGERLIARAYTVWSGSRQAVCRCEIMLVRDGEETICAAAQGTIVKTG